MLAGFVESLIMPRDYYEILGVKRDASEVEIKHAYRHLAREHHPDRNPGDKGAETRFKEVQEAYDVVGDKDKRSQYDQFGHAGAQGGANGAPGGFQWGGGFGEGVQIDPSQIEEFLRRTGMGGLGDMGGQRTRSSGRSRRAAPREPVTHDLPVPFETAVLGGTMSLEINGQEIDVRVPGGVEEGKTLRLQGQGPGGADLHLKIRIEPHPYFRREGNDLLITAPVSVAEAVLGTKIDVPTLDGAKLTVKIPAGASSGSRLRLRGKGIKGGDQYVEIKIVAPTKLDERSKKLMAEFAQLNPQQPRSGPPWE
jgi:curved DNA-binding protein